MCKLSYKEAVKKIRAVAAARYGDEIYVNDGRESGTECWRFGNARGDCIDHDPLWWRLDVWRDDVQSHALFNLESDYTDEIIESRLVALEVAREEFIKSQNAESEKEERRVIRDTRMLSFNVEDDSRTGESVGYCNDFPDLSFRAKTIWEALRGIKSLVRKIVSSDDERFGHFYSPDF